MDDLETLLTESRNPATENIDQLSTVEMLQSINEADRWVIDAVAQEIPNIASAVDQIVKRLRSGGHLVYVGAGTSGRLGVLDASECPSTFGVSPEMVQGIIAGGEMALREPTEGAEDDAQAVVTDLQRRGFVRSDVLVGIAASGRTPFVLAGIAYANSLGAMTVGLSCVPGSELARSAQIAITPAVGPEVIAGSTRMKAGTATKLVLNMLSTGSMIRLGCVYGNLMVNLTPTNEKLHQRAVRIVAEVTGMEKDDAAALLEQAGAVKTAIIMQKSGLSREAAVERIAQSGGRMREAMK
ncbi:MAG: N-acetylmuramic acid 6-phosphate etherase [Terracidiphilus sp.]